MIIYKNYSRILTENDHSCIIIYDGYKNVKSVFFIDKKSENGEIKW